MRGHCQSPAPEHVAEESAGIILDVPVPIMQDVLPEGWMASPHAGELLGWGLPPLGKPHAGMAPWTALLDIARAWANMGALVEAQSTGDVPLLGVKVADFGCRCVLVPALRGYGRRPCP